MSNILRRGKDDSDDEYTDTEPAPQTMPVAPANNYIEPTVTMPATVKPKYIRKPPTVPKVHICGDCGEHFARATTLTRHVNELRCTVKRQQSMSKEQEYADREKRLRDLETEISNKILKSQEKVVKPRKKRVAKPKAPPVQQAQPVHQAQPVQQQQPQRRRPIVNF
jgi:hypothetical protein